MRLRDVFKQPYHYYPAPHMIASTLGDKQLIRHKESGQEGWAHYRGTHDSQIALRTNKREQGVADDIIYLCPDEVEVAQKGNTANLVKA